MKTLVIVESPAKAKTIGKYLGDGYEVYEQATKVVAKYNLSDDYGSDFDVTRTIERCSKAN